jgi:hypothetical protein
LAVDVTTSVTVRRPRRAVADYMFDPANDLEWTGGITASRPARPGPLAVGSAVEREARFLGRRFTYGYVVTEHEPDRSLTLKVDRPFPMLVRYLLADAGDGATDVTINASGDPGRFFGWLTPVMSRQVRRSIASDLTRLRAAVEGRPG